MYDSVDLTQVPEHAQAVAGYVDGKWPTFSEVKRRWPNVKHLSIAVSASADAECLDIETGDATVAEAVDWLVRQERRGVVCPVFYVERSRLPELVALLMRAGVASDRYRIWSAHYTDVPHIDRGAGATQWTDHALGLNLDESLCGPEFFSPKAGPLRGTHLGLLLEPELRLVNTYDHYIRHPRLHRHGLAVTREAMLVVRKLIWRKVDEEIKAGVPTSQAWSRDHRGARYAMLKARTEGMR